MSTYRVNIEYQDTLIPIKMKCAIIFSANEDWHYWNNPIALKELSLSLQLEKSLRRWEMWLKPAFKKLEEVHDDSWTYWTNHQLSSTFQSPAVFTSHNHSQWSYYALAISPCFLLHFDLFFTYLRTLANLIQGPRLIRKDPDAGKDRRQEEKGTTEDEMAGWHHRLNGHEFEKALGDGEGQGSLVGCSPWGHKELDITERVNNS